MEILRQKLLDLLLELGLSDLLASIISDVSLIVLLIVLSVIVYFIVKLIFVKTIKKVGLRSKKIFLVSLLESPLSLNVLKLIPAIFLFQMIKLTPSIEEFLSVVLTVVIAYLSIKIINSILDLFNTLYNSYNKQAGLKPIKGVTTFIKAVLISVVVIIVISDLIGQSPVTILTGLGAMSAVLMLIFKDSILGLVAGFQMSTNDLIRIGDWIEMPKYGVDGDVVDVTLTFVKVQNWDKTTVTIPAYLLISESFVNWRSVFNIGGRRIKRSISIDNASVKIVDDQLYEKLLKVDFLKDYLTTKKEEIDAYNKEKNIDTSIELNGRRLTNLGVFRIYVTEYLKRNPNVHQELFMLVRQLQSENKGIPLEIYAFSKHTAWATYEGVMADIFDHIYATITYFDLRLFQEPSGHDISSRLSKDEQVHIKN